MKAFILFCMLTLSVSAAAIKPQGAPHWQSAGRGLEVLRVTWQRPDGREIVMVAARADLSLYRLRVLAAAPDLKKTWRADEMRRRTGAVVAVNGPFFDTDGRAMGLIIADGQALQRMPPPSSANGSVLSVQGDALRIQPRDDFKADGVDQAVQCAPRLLVEGKPTDRLLDKDRTATRIVVALTGDHHVILLCVPEWSTGASFQDLQDMLRHPLLQATDAMCMDGGASTQMSLPGVDIQARDAVPVGLGLFLRNR